MKHKAAWLVAILLAAVAAPLVAANFSPDDVKRLEGVLPLYDKNHDQTLDAAERQELEKMIEDQHGADLRKRAAAILDAADANHDGKITLDEWTALKNSVIAAAGGPDAKKPDAADTANKQTVMVPMSDGAKLATDVYLPKGDGPWPAILTRTPYSRKNAGGAGGIVANGCVFVAQDMRGRFDSEGENLPFVGCGWADHQDGADTVAWILKQPWSNGKVGTVGGSAGGITQLLMAGAAPPGLVAQYIHVAPPSMYYYASYIGGALRKEQIENWTTGNHFDPKALQLMRDHPSYDDYWRKLDTSTRLAVINVPGVHVGGWFDTFQQGTIDAFVMRQHKAAEGARGRQRLVMGPWTHGGAASSGCDLTFPNKAAPKDFDAPDWFAHWLKGVDNGVEKAPPVAYYVMGDTSDPKAPGNQWRTAADWPVPATDTPYYFAKGGGLLVAPPPDPADTFVAYTFDPGDPCPTIGGKNLTIPAGPRNQNWIESRKDVLLFTTAPLAAPVEVTGRVRAKVYLASSAVDTDLSVRLCDVYPDGKSYEMAEGIQRARYRNSSEKPEPLKPGEVTEITVDCWSTSIVFNKGHRIRAIVTSSNYPRFDLNPGTGEPWSDTGVKVIQANRIFCDSKHPSRLVLPIVKP
jgi:hypothetical protein